MGIDWDEVASAGGIPKSRDGKLRVEEKRAKRLADDDLERDARREVRARDGYRCSVPGCRENGSELHHIVRRSRSVAKRWDVDNLVYLCRSHHRLEHGGKIHISRNAEGELIVTGDRKYLEFRL